MYNPLFYYSKSILKGYFFSTAVPIFDFMSIPVKLLKLQTNYKKIDIGRWSQRNRLTDF